MAIAKAVMRRISVTGVYQGLPVEKARFTVTDTVGRVWIRKYEVVISVVWHKPSHRITNNVQCAKFNLCGLLGATCER